jgi:Flp pilus assembly protein TadG
MSPVEGWIMSRVVVFERIVASLVGALRDLGRDVAGSSAPMSSILLSVTIGTVGLGTDYGLWVYSHQRAQAAADSAAVSAGAVLSSGAADRIAGQATAVAAAYGFRNDGTGQTVTVNWPPTSGKYSGKSYAVEVIVQEQQQRLFSADASEMAPTVTGRSVALGNTGDGCALALNRTVSGAITAQGSTSVTLNNCSLIANSASSSAVSAGGSASVTALSVNTVGDVSGVSHFDVSAGINTSLSPVADPYASMSVPSLGSCSAHNTTVKNSASLGPGVYCGGISVNAGATATLSPGIYYIDQGSLTVNGGGTLTGSGVTLIFTSSTGKNYATASLNGGANIDLTAPTMGWTAGLVMIADRNAPVGTTYKLNGGATQRLGGVIYTPSGALTYAGGSSTTTSCTKMIADTITFTGNSNLAASCSSYALRNFGTVTARLGE